jgi:Tol biopolymer transport system component
VAQTGSGGVESRLSWCDRSGKLLGNVGPPLSYANPALSPDGKRVAYDQRRPPEQEIGIWVHDLATDVATKLTLDQSLNQVPVWNVDGK